MESIGGINTIFEDGDKIAKKTINQTGMHNVLPLPGLRPPPLLSCRSLV